MQGRAGLRRIQHRRAGGVEAADAGQALVTFMSSPEAAPLIRKSGMEPRRTDGDLSSSMARNQDRSHTLEGGWGLSHVRPVPVGSLT